MDNPQPFQTVDLEEVIEAQIMKDPVAFAQRHELVLESDMREGVN